MGSVLLRSKPKAPAAKKAGPVKKAKAKPAPGKSQIGTIRAGTLKRAAPAKKAASAASDVGLVDQFRPGAGQLFRAGDERYTEKEVSGTKANGAQRIVGYKGSYQKGSAP